MLISKLKITVFLYISARNFLKTSGNSDFSIPKAKLVFFQLRQTFIIKIIFHYFDLKCFIYIKTYVSSHVISKILSKLILASSYEHFVVLFFKKMILVKTYQEIFNQKLLAIFQVFNTWCYYFKSYKYKVFILLILIVFKN